MEIKLSAVLKKVLKGRRLSQVAAEAGISKSLLHDWTSGGRRPSGKNMPQLKKLADHLGLTLDEILFDVVPQRVVIATTRFSDEGNEYKICIERLKR